jgi:hypothetical protein
MDFEEIVRRIERLEKLAQGTALCDYFLHYQ